MTMPDRKITHIGYVVTDIDEAVAWAVSTLGAGPFFLIPHLHFDTCTFNGEPAEYDHTSAFGQWGGIIVELTVVHSSRPSELAEMVGEPAPRVGHVGWLADDLLADSALLEAEGLPVFHTGASGPVSARWHDARGRLGHHIEILGRTPQLEAFYELIRSSSVGWDGSAPLRPGPGG
jgi:hypothetical protein